MDELVEVAVSLLLNHFDEKSSMPVFEDGLSHMVRLCLEAVNKLPQDPFSELSGFDFILNSKGFGDQDSMVWAQAHRSLCSSLVKSTQCQWEKGPVRQEACPRAKE